MAANSWWLVGGSLALLIYVLIIGSSVSVLIMKNRSPNQTLVWVLALVFVPMLGLIFYLNIGQGYQRRKRYARKGSVDLARTRDMPPYQEEPAVGEALIQAHGRHPKVQLMRLLLANSKAQLSQRNRVKLLQNGKETYPALLEAMAQAKHHIHLQYYILEGGKISQQIAQCLKAKAEAGVEVRLLYDAFGSLELPGSYLRDLEASGVKTAAFGSIRFPFFAHNLNYRNHRKVVVIDGKVGFTGGVNISDKYLRDDPELGLWRDTHLRVEGEAVHGLQAIFLNDWNYVQDEEEIQGPAYFPQEFPSQGPLVQVAPSGPDSPWWGILQAYFSAIALAEEHVYISTPYFIPDSALRMVLTTKAMSGVDVRILLPGRSDIPIQWYAAFSFVEELLSAGVKVYRYQRGFNHGKIMAVDGHFASVGTANMDLRSFRKNFEVNAFVYDAAFTQRLEQDFLADLADSELLDYETYRRRPRRQKVAEALGRLVSPAL